MPNYTEKSIVGQILDEQPGALDLFNPDHRDQLGRFRDHPLSFAAQYIGLPPSKLAALLESLNKL